MLAETPRESDGLLELVPNVARRALELGLSSREPSFHVFVSAEPEVMIEDDIVRYASRFASTRPTPCDIAYVHDFDRPEAPRPLVLPPGVGPALVAAMDGLIRSLQERIPAVVDGEEFKERKRASPPSSKRKTGLSFETSSRSQKRLVSGCEPVHGGVQTFPILHGKPVSAEQFDVLDDSTKRALAESEDKLTREVDKAAQQVRAQSARSDVAREAALSKAAAAIIESAIADLERAFGSLGADVRRGSIACSGRSSRIGPTSSSTTMRRSTRSSSAKTRTTPSSRRA